MKEIGNTSFFVEEAYVPGVEDILSVRIGKAKEALLYKEEAVEIINAMLAFFGMPSYTEVVTELELALDGTWDHNMVKAYDVLQRAKLKGDA